MTKRNLEEIRRWVRDGKYDLTFHAVEEMAEDYLVIFDVEAAVISGSLEKTESDDPRGTRYTIVGTGADQKTAVGLVGRFTDTDIFLIVTVYEVTND